VPLKKRKMPDEIPFKKELFFMKFLPSLPAAKKIPGYHLILYNIPQTNQSSSAINSQAVPFLTPIA